MNGTNEPLTYTITVSNGGPQDATGVTVSDPLPGPGLQFISASSTQGMCHHTHSTTGGTVTCKLGRLANGATATVTIVVTAPHAPVCGTDFCTNTASVSGNQTDPTPADNSATAVTLFQIGG